MPVEEVIAPKLSLASEWRPALLMTIRGAGPLGSIISLLHLGVVYLTLLMQLYFHLGQTTGCRRWGERQHLGPPQNFRPLKQASPKRLGWLRDPPQIPWLPSWLVRAAALRRGASVDRRGRGQEIFFFPYTRASSPP